MTAASSKSPISDKLKVVIDQATTDPDRERLIQALEEIYRLLVEQETRQPPKRRDTGRESS